MDFEHTLLLILFFLPLAYKIAFWKDIFLSSDISEKQKLVRGLTHFFSYIELPLFLLSFLVYYNADLEVFFFNFFLYFFLLVHIFIIGKICRTIAIFGKEPFLNLSLALLSVLLCFFIGDFFGVLYVYMSMTFFYIIGAFYLGLQSSYR